MRTSIFLGLLAIADAIRENWLQDDAVKTFLVIFLVLIMYMDFSEFIKKQKEK
jgi:hypothetical protein